MSFNLAGKSYRKLLVGKYGRFKRRMASSGKFDFSAIVFDNKALRTLPLDNVIDNYTRTVSGACFSRVKPTPVESPELVIYSESALELLDIWKDATKDKEFAEYFSGNKLLKGSEPAAHCYCGHQFGSFAGQLGDGATMYLGEIINSKKERWELQFKGAGPTPYSRSADGRKVLRSSLREFLCSEAMAALGVPTTRAPTCVTSEDRVIRDIFYDGNPIHEKCSIITRTAPTFIRFGSFEIFKTQDQMTGRRGPSVGQTDILKLLLDYVIETFYPEIWASNDQGSANGTTKYETLYATVVQRTAQLVAWWQCVGFCHGVLNTDNMSIMGLTIDYGPFGFMEKFNPDFICNASDNSGRYAYNKQRSVCKWNLMKLGEALQPLLPLNVSSKVLEDTYDQEFGKFYLDKMRKKLGLTIQSLDKSQGDVLSDKMLVELFLETMAKTMSDFTNCFRSLSTMPLPGDANFELGYELLLHKLLAECSTVEELIVANESAMDSREVKMMLMLMQANPRILEQLGFGPEQISMLISKAEKSEATKTLNPEDKRNSDEASWRHFLDKYQARLVHDMSKIKTGQNALNALNEERTKVMLANNPRFVLRNYLAQAAIEKAEEGDYSEVWRLFKVLQDPYTDQDIDLDTGVPSRTAVTEAGPSGVCRSIELYEGKTPGDRRTIKVT